jgi:hypothetical protein
MCRCPYSGQGARWHRHQAPLRGPSSCYGCYILNYGQDLMRGMQTQSVLRTWSRHSAQLEYSLVARGVSIGRRWSMHCGHVEYALFWLYPQSTVRLSDSWLRVRNHASQFHVRTVSHGDRARSPSGQFHGPLSCSKASWALVGSLVLIVCGGHWQFQCCCACLW